MNLAEKYLEKYNGDITVFSEILNPLASHHLIEGFNV